MAISDRRYNAARQILVSAGSATAAAAHVQHTQRAGVPDHYGTQLLVEARNEFRAADVGQPGLRSQMTAAHYGAVHGAAAEMNIDHW